MHRTSRFLLAMVMLVVGAAGRLVAQQPVGPLDQLAPLQAKNTLSEEEQATLRTWVEQRVLAIAAGDPVGANQPAREIRSNHKGTDGFKQLYAAVCVEAVRAAYHQAARDGAARLIALLNTMNEPATAPLLLEALRDERTPVRTAAAIGLRNLRDKLGRAGGNVLAETLNALQAAGSRETSVVTLEQIYRALDYSTAGAGPDPRATAAALLDLLEARAQGYAAGQVKAEGGDRPGLEAIGRLLGQLDEAARRRLAIAVARMLRYSVERYASELYNVREQTSSPVQVALRDRMELLIAEAEQLLAKLTPAPADEGFKTITVRMQESKEADKPTEMKIAMNRWAELLQQRFQIDVRMDATVPTTAEAGHTPPGEAPAP